MVLHHCLKTNRLLVSPPTCRQKRAVALPVLAKANRAPLRPHAAVRARRVARRSMVAGASGFLRDLRVAPMTRQRYRDVLVGMAQANKISFDLLNEAPEVVDAFAEAFVERRFIENGDRSEGGYVLAAIAFFFVWSLRDANVLPLTKAAVQRWKRYEPDSARLPCPWIVALLLARWLAQQNDAAMLQSARALILQFDLMARPGEIIGVMQDVVCMPRRRLGGAYGTPAVVFAPSDELVPVSPQMPPPPHQDGRAGRHRRGRLGVARGRRHSASPRV